MESNLYSVGRGLKESNILMYPQVLHIAEGLEDNNI